MIDLAVLQSVSYVAATIGVCLAAAYYILTLRNAERIRRKEFISQRLEVPMQYYDAFYTVIKMTDWNTIEEFRSKYTYWVDQEKYVKFSYILNHYNAVGTLYKDSIANPEEIFQIYLPQSFIWFYEKFEPVIKSYRITLSGEIHNPDAYKGLELLYLEAKKRYPKTPPMPASFEETVRYARGYDEHLQKKTPK